MIDEGKAMGQWAYYGINSQEDKRTAALNEVIYIEQQLKNRIQNESFVPWGRKQQNDWDKRTNFIYKISSWEDFKKYTSNLPKPIRNYALNRWFNFWSANGVENIFCSLPGVEPNLNKYDRLIDFSINRISFDHKTTVYPKRYSHPINYAIENPLSLIKWLYDNQSKQQRFHLANRLFIVLYDQNGVHWKLRAELKQLYEIIANYVLSFDATQLPTLSLQQKQIRSDIIWFTKGELSK
jgi:hypothetical protein